MFTDSRHQGLELDLLALLQTGDIFLPGLLDTRVAAGLEAVLEPRDILLDLVHHRELFGERQQSGIRRGMDLLDRGGAGRDQGRIDLVVLGPLQLELRIGAHLCRLKHHHDKSLAPQLGDNDLLIAATRLNPDTLDPMASQPVQQRLVSFRRVVDLQLRRAAVERDVELPFAGVNPGTDCGTLSHLRRPSLAMRTLGSFNHPGPDEVPIAISLRKTVLQGFGGHRSDQSAAQFGWPPGLGHSSWNDVRIDLRANTRVGKAQACPPSRPR